MPVTSLCFEGGIFTAAVNVTVLDTTRLPTAFSRSQFAQPLIRLGWFILPVKLPAISVVESARALPLASLGLEAIFLHFSTSSVK